MPNQPEKQQRRTLTLPLKKLLPLEGQDKFQSQLKQLTPANDFQIGDDVQSEEGQHIQHEDEKEHKKTEPQQKSREKFKHVLDWVLGSFPQCFNLENPLPLKRQVEFDIFARLPVDGSISKISIRSVLRYYVNRIPYQEAVLAEQRRFDLQGIPVEEIAENQKEYTRKQLSRRKAKKNKHFNKSTDSGDSSADNRAA